MTGTTALATRLDELLDAYANALFIHKGDRHDVEDCSVCSQARTQIHSFLDARTLMKEELELLSWIFKEYRVHKQHPAFVDRIDLLKREAGGRTS